ncbi:MAG: sulfopyruvate decarboxylase subunit beta [Promethearchaeota archaeon]
MKRYDALKEIVSVLRNELVVCNLGTPSRELYHIKDRDENFYMLGSMGLASSIAFGLAISRPNKKVWCIEGDGSMLMNLGSLSTIANNASSVPNFTLIIIDNGSYGSTGDQKTYTSKDTKLEVIAEGAGFKSIKVINNKEDIVPTLKNLNLECNFILIKVMPGNAQVNNIPLKAERLKERFMTLISS